MFNIIEEIGRKKPTAPAAAPAPAVKPPAPSNPTPMAKILSDIGTLGEADQKKVAAQILGKFGGRPKKWNKVPVDPAAAPKT